MKAYKGFDKDMKCRGFQFEEGKTYEEKEAKLCECGFHACESPLDVFRHYEPCDNKGNLNHFREVELDEVSPERNSDDSKVCAKKITIGAELNFFGLAKAHVEWVKSNLDKSKNDENTGDYSAATNTGDCSAATNTGYYSAATNTGDYSAATNTGDCSAATNTGDCSAATNTGDCSAATNTGDCSAATNTGYRSAATNTGKDGIAVAWGMDSKAMGALGTYIVCSEWKYKGCERVLKSAKMHKVDGKVIKPNVWYTLKDGKFVEVQDE